MVFIVGGPWSFPDAWYWAQDPSQPKTTNPYSSARQELVPWATDTDFFDFLAANNVPAQWPADENSDYTDASLYSAIVLFGFTTGTLSSLSAALLSAASGAADAIVQQIYTGPVRAASGPALAAIVAAAGGAPSSGPYYTAFNAAATAFGTLIANPTLTPAEYAVIVTAFINAVVNLNVALDTLDAAVAAAASSSDLATALTAFETAIGSVVGAVNATVGLPPTTLVAPAAIVIVGINA